MDNESDTFAVRMPQKILQNIPLNVDDYALDYPFSMASNNSSTDFAQVMKIFEKFYSFSDIYDLFIVRVDQLNKRFPFFFYYRSLMGRFSM